ncbi:MAG: Nucleoside triphosphate pyrophosphohydrolase [Candidatus Erwinia impunctatus]|nr:Nucleoside triphosphate pyrophosphohydrolase [Culicoides impunctatus]
MQELQQLLDIMVQLRDPQLGCPWDRQQTFQSIIPYTLEETYEVIDAIQRDDIDSLRGELGDLLFQVVFYAQLAQEQGHFDFRAICQSINDKLVQRHPHVFAQEQAATAEVALAGWENIKQAERADKSQLSALDDITRALPALMRSHKIQTRCHHVGFDWKSLPPVVEKVEEELAEVMHEVHQAEVDHDKLEEEIGDLLFATVNLARHLGSKAEIALQKANDKFERRFRQVEEIIHQQGMLMNQASLEQMEQAWQQVKAKE